MAICPRCGATNTTGKPACWNCWAYVPPDVEEPAPGALEAEAAGGKKGKRKEKAPKKGKIARGKVDEGLITDAADLLPPPGAPPADAGMALPPSAEPLPAGAAAPGGPAAPAPDAAASEEPSDEAPPEKPKKRGAAGLIVIAVIIVLLGGGAAGYLFVPPVHRMLAGVIEHIPFLAPDPAKEAQAAAKKYLEALKLNRTEIMAQLATPETKQKALQAGVIVTGYSTFAQTTVSSPTATVLVTIMYSSLPPGSTQPAQAQSTQVNIALVRVGNTWYINQSFLDALRPANPVPMPPPGPSPAPPPGAPAAPAPPMAAPPAAAPPAAAPPAAPPGTAIPFKPGTATPTGPGAPSTPIPSAPNVLPPTRVAPGVAHQGGH